MGRGRAKAKQTKVARELKYASSALRFNQSRAVAIDMESATIAAQGYRFRVPYGTLLCVSDRPLHGEIKLPGQANRFYEGSISEHLQIGIQAVDQAIADSVGLKTAKGAMVTNVVDGDPADKAGVEAGGSVP